MRLIFLPFIALSLTAASCDTTGGLFNAPAPLAKTTIDEKTLIVSLQTFDTLLTAVDRLTAAGVIKAGSPRAIQIANAIHKAKLAYQAASAAQRAGNGASYLAALNDARTAIADINLLIKGN